MYYDPDNWLDGTTTATAENGAPLVASVNAVPHNAAFIATILRETSDGGFAYHDGFESRTLEQMRVDVERAYPGIWWQS